MGKAAGFLDQLKHRFSSLLMVMRLHGDGRSGLSSPEIVVTGCISVRGTGTAHTQKNIKTHIRDTIKTLDEVEMIDFPVFL